MDHPLTRLLTEEFYVLYFERVQVIERLFGVHAEVEIDQLRLAHEAWLAETYELIQKDRTAPEADGFWVQILSVLAKHICRTNIVAYSILNKPNNIAVAQIQKLIIEYPNEYTGLDFSRSAHLEIFYMIHAFRQSGATSLYMDDVESLQDILKEIKTRPALAGDYASLLRLPV